MGSHLADNEWHQVELRRTGLNILLILDVTRKSKVAPGSYNTLELDNRIYIAGVDHVGMRDARMRHGRNVPFTQFEGCLQDVIVNGKNLLKMARNHDISTQIHGPASFTCPRPLYTPITFTNPKSHILLSVSLSSALRVSFRFRTYDEDGALLVHRLKSSRGVSVGLVLRGGSVILDAEFPNPHQRVRLHAGRLLHDGFWHLVSISVSGTSVRLEVDHVVDQVAIKPRLFAHNPVVHFGGTGSDLKGFIGCMYDIYTNGRLADASKATNIGILIGVCSPLDYCLPNPCHNGGRCLQRLNETSCDCTGTNYKGWRCEVPAEPRRQTCADWKAAGKTANGYYRISPGKAKPFTVFCNMNGLGGPITVIDHVWGHAPVRAADIHQRRQGFYIHAPQYDTDMASIKALVSRSATCRQYLRYDCLNSVLFDSPHAFDLKGGRGARWKSRDGDVMDYWAGATPRSEKCACGLTNTCVRHDLVCNCDAWDSVWRSDGGYITDFTSLPVQEVIFNVRGTGLKSNFTLGSLECFGTRSESPSTTKAKTNQHTTASTQRISRTFSKTFLVPTQTKPTPSSPSEVFITKNNNIPDAAPTTKSDTDFNNPPPVIIVDSPRKFITIRQSSNQEIILIILSVVLAIFIIIIIVLMVRQNLFLPCKCLDGPAYRDVRNIDSVELGPPDSLFTNAETEIVEYEGSPYSPRNFEVGYLNRNDVIVVASRAPARMAQESDEETDRLDFSNDSSSPTESQLDKDEEEKYEQLEMTTLKSPQKFVDGVQIGKLKEALFDVISASEVNINNNPVAKETKQVDTETTEYESQQENTLDRYGMDFQIPPSYDHSINDASRTSSESSLDASTHSMDATGIGLVQDESSTSSSCETLPKSGAGCMPFAGSHSGKYANDMQYYCSYETEDICSDMCSEDYACLEKRNCKPVQPETEVSLPVSDAFGACPACGDDCDCDRCELTISGCPGQTKGSSVCSLCCMSECECEENSAAPSVALIAGGNCDSQYYPPNRKKENRYSSNRKTGEGCNERFETSL
ncbi:contactin-associated protein like 5-3 isoform X2 [Nematostella vectensis]|nr:contactin-associated protein like 5-3 isoform X2 [Nematostella vectensis]